MGRHPRSQGSTGAGISERKAPLRHAALNMLQMGYSLQETAAVFQVCTQTLVNWRLKAAKTGASLADAPRSGRPPVLSREQAAMLRWIASQQSTASVRKAATELARQGGPQIGAATAWRVLNSGGFHFQLARYVPLLTAKHRAARVAFAAQHAQTDWLKYAFTDSKIFTMYSTGQHVGFWQPAAEPPHNVGVARHGPSLHVYMLITPWGVSKLIEVSGGSIKNKTHATKAGQLARGCGSAEYQRDVLPALAASGNRLYGHGNGCPSRRYRNSWMLQQDGAPAHREHGSLAMARTTAPGGLLEPWPAMSPDLSLIEHVWAWMAREVRCGVQPRNLDELRASLEIVRRRISVEHLQHLYSGMPKRLVHCIKLEGATVK